MNTSTNSQFLMPTDTATNFKTLSTINTTYYRERRAEPRLFKVMSTDPTSATILRRGHFAIIQIPVTVIEQHTMTKSHFTMFEPNQ